jgi:hypothetical protein
MEVDRMAVDAPDVYADVASVNRSQVGYTLDFLVSDPPIPGTADVVTTRLVARIRCGEPFIAILAQVLAKSLTQELPPVEFPPTRMLTNAQQVVSSGPIAQRGRPEPEGLL